MCCVEECQEVGDFPVEFKLNYYYGKAMDGVVIIVKNAENFLCTFTVILEKTIRIPRSLSVKAASVLKGFLNKNPADRLGCHPETGFLDILHHPFFKSIDWDLVSRLWVF